MTYQPGDRVKREDLSPRQPWLATRHYGTVLALDDPRAWPGATPEELTAHIAFLRRERLDRDMIMVAWDFGRTYVEHENSIAPAEPIEQPLALVYGA